MIRECFKSKSDIIFDAHMLRNEVGFDVNFTIQAPDLLPLGTHRLVKPGNGELKGFTLRQVPLAILSTLFFPFRWVWGELKNIILPESPHIPTPKKPGYEGEPHEELHDALSPIYDQLTLYRYWRFMEWIPCELLLPARSHRSELMTPPGIIKRQEAEETDLDGFSACKFVCVHSFRDLSVASSSVIDYVDFQLEPWARPHSV
jgi:hypothetical protein